MMIGMVTQIQFIGILEIMKGSGGHLEKKKLKKYKYDGEIDGSRNRDVDNRGAIENLPRLLTSPVSSLLHKLGIELGTLAIERERERHYRLDGSVDLTNARNQKEAIH